MSFGAAFTVYAARASAIFYAAGVALLLTGDKHDRSARIAWTLACALLWIHVASAFGLIHHWSPLQAYRFTEEQTARMTGVRSGIGIYLNYLAMIVWAADCTYWWTAGVAAYRRRRRGISIAVHAYLLFMVFNATVVFGGPGARFGGAIIFSMLLLLALRRRYGRRSPDAASITE